jgi:hypothetical protein
MKHNVEDAITYEVKREIADRYFGFRKLIEDDTRSLADQVQQHTRILEKRISFDFIRIYILLKDEELIKDFLNLIGIQEELFYDPYLTESPTIRQRVFEKVCFRGLTSKGCFENAIVDSYERLTEHISQYRETFAELLDNQEMIKEEIKLFYKKNDLGSIIGFLRSLGEFNLGGNHMQGGIETDIAGELEKRLQIPQPDPIEHFLPVLPPLPPLSAIKKELKKIINRAYKNHKADIHHYISGETSFLRRAFG